MAQLVARKLCMFEVRGSKPRGSIFCPAHHFLPSVSVRWSSISAYLQNIVRIRNIIILFHNQTFCSSDFGFSNFDRMGKRKFSLADGLMRRILPLIEARRQSGTEEWNVADVMTDFVRDADPMLKRQKRQQIEQSVERVIEQISSESW